VLAEFEMIRDEGFTSIKVFSAVPGFQLSDPELLAVLRKAAERESSSTSTRRTARASTT